MTNGKKKEVFLAVFLATLIFWTLVFAAFAWIAELHSGWGLFHS